MTSSASQQLLLRPGVRVVRRSPHEWQVGLAPGASLVLPDSTDVRTLLGALAVGAATPASVWRDKLAAAGLVVHRSLVDALLPAALADQRQLLAALTRLGDETEPMVWARSKAQIEVVQHGTDTRSHADALGSALTRAGLGTQATRPRPDVVVLISDGPFGRRLTDELMRRDVPHLPMVLTQGTWQVGPFVDPGVTACQRCVDHGHTDRDPRWPLLVEQSSRWQDPRGLPSPADATLTSLAISLAVAHVAAWVEGASVPTWSATVRVDHDFDLTPTPWPRHPACGCTWADLATG